MNPVFLRVLVEVMAKIKKSGKFLTLLIWKVLYSVLKNNFETVQKLYTLCIRTQNLTIVTLATKLNQKRKILLIATIIFIKSYNAQHEPGLKLVLRLSVS